LFFGGFTALILFGVLINLVNGYLRTDNASLRLDRQRIASFSSLRTDSASLRFVAAGALW
jgi:hypothetical protein